MKNLFTILIFAIAFASCNNSDNPESAELKKPAIEKSKFFPVTGFLKGAIFTIKKNEGPFKKYITINEKTDSVYLNPSDLDEVLREFLTPEIDTANLATLFTEKSFIDQTINAVTLTYEPVASLPDSMKLVRWDVYIDPDNGSVRRIYLVKEISKNKTLQLTWVVDEWCKIITIITDDKGISNIEKEEKIIWDPNK